MMEEGQVTVQCYTDGHAQCFLIGAWHVDTLVMISDRETGGSGFFLFFLIMPVFFMRRSLLQSITVFKALSLAV